MPNFDETSLAIPPLPGCTARAGLEFRASRVPASGLFVTLRLKGQSYPRAFINVSIATCDCQYAGWAGVQM